MGNYFDKKSWITEGDLLKNFDDTYPDVSYVGWENIKPMSAEEWGDYITWVANKRGYLFMNEDILDLGPEYSYKQYLEEKKV